jgi:hypothetical protein
VKRGVGGVDWQELPNEVGGVRYENEDVTPKQLQHAVCEVGGVSLAAWQPPLQR